MKVAVACGGTGGHIFPGLATARELLARGHVVTLWLSGRSVESLSVDDWHGPIERVRASGLPSGVSLKAVLTAFRLLSAVLVCRRRMGRTRPDVVLAMGSYASVGPVLAARLLRIPVVLHEANAVPGRAVAFLSRYATAVGVAFDSARDGLHCRRVELTGMPVRPPSERRLEHPGLEEGRFTVLVMGGSQGAHALNGVVPAALAQLNAAGVPVQVIHATGTADEEAVREAYTRAGVPHAVFGFLREVDEAYRRADFAVCRSGASTCSELAQYGVPALLVPYPQARRDHQAANARALGRTGAVDVLAQSELEKTPLAEYLKACWEDDEKRRRMARALRLTCVPDAALRLAELVESCGASPEA